MNDLEKLLKCLFHPASVILLIVALCVGISLSQSAKEESAAAAEPKVLKSIEERLEIKSRCLNGIEYWVYKGTSQTLTLTPKWSQYQNHPDSCVVKK